MVLITISIWTPQIGNGDIQIFLPCVSVHLITEPGALICCLHSSEKTFHKILEPCCRDLFPFSERSVSEVGHWCWAIRSDPYDGDEVRALCRSVRFFHSKLGKLFFIDLSLCMGAMSSKKQDRAFHRVGRTGLSRSRNIIATLSLNSN